MQADLQEIEWRRLYARLKLLLESHGRESPFGEGDFWLVDDNWSGNLQKVCVFNISFVTQKIVGEVQELLRKVAPGWGVLFALELKNDGESVKTVPADGLTVFSDHFEQAWDTARLKSVFGDKFHF